jgi:hypothetical protein
VQRSGANQATDQDPDEHPPDWFCWHLFSPRLAQGDPYARRDRHGYCDSIPRQCQLPYMRQNWIRIYRYHADGLLRYLSFYLSFRLVRVARARELLLVCPQQMVFRL